MTPEVPEAPPVLTIEEVVPEARPWGAWATVGWSLLIMFAALVAQVIALFVVGLVMAFSGVRIDFENVNADGNLLAVAACASGLAGIGFSILFAAIRKGITVKEYLGLRWPRGKEFAKYLGLLVALIAVSDGISLLLGKPIVPDFMIDTYQSASWGLPLLAFAVLVTAPVSEEFFFRGFMLEGLWRSRLGRIGAVIITAAVWAGIHVQYDWHGILMIFFGGLILGMARLKTGSLWLCVILHSIQNLIATVEMLVVLSRAG